jgi:5-methylcytosine-specific restriction enzyme A
MGRLKSLPPLLKVQSLSSIRIPEGRRECDAMRNAQAWRRWYRTARWLALRLRILGRDHWTCQWPGCHRSLAGKGMAVVDHKVPHRGDEARFWDEGNLWALCKPCHDGAKARAERAGRL